MPIYQFQCLKCNGIEEKFFSFNELKRTGTCPRCNGKMVKIISSPQLMPQGKGIRDKKGERIWFPSDGKPYYDRSLQVTFNTPKDKKEYMDKNNLIMDGTETRIRTESGDLRDKSTRKQLRMED